MWRESIFYNYEGYFGKRRAKSEDEDRPVGPMGPQFDYQKWQWHLMVDKLVKELNLSPEVVYKMNYIDCLNWLSLYHERDKYIDQVNRQQMSEIKNR